MTIITNSPTDDQPPPRQEGEAGTRPWLGQIRDGAGVGGREREQFDTGEVVVVIEVIKASQAANHHLS